MCGQLRDLDSIFKPKIADVAPGVLSSMQDLGASLVYYSTFTSSSLISRCTAQSCFSRYADGKIRSRQIIRKMTFPICQFFVCGEVTESYIDFFTATIRNRNTRAAYARACWQLFDWCAAHGLELTTVRPFHVAAWIEDFPGSKPTIKLKLAAVRMLYDFLVVRQITPSNPAHSVRGPKYVVKKGKTPVWSREDAKTLLDSIPKDSVSGLRDRALIAGH